MMNINKSKLYMTLLSVLGVVIFALNIELSNHSLSNWVLIYLLTGSVLLINFFNIILPPNGNTLSMDTAVYLAALYLFGLDVTLTVLLLSSIFGLFFFSKIQWLKHLFNFANYSLIILAAYTSFLILGGTIGDTNFTNLIPYIVSISIYFILNVIIIGIYFYLYSAKELINMLKGILKKGILKESLVSYTSTIILALVLTILLEATRYFGLFLFTLLIVLLSFAFTKFFTLYKEVEEKANKDFLTDLFNHGYFKLQLDEHLKQMESYEVFSVAILDIDDFKKYNDLNGHLQGDELLKFFGSYLKEKTEPFGKIWWRRIYHFNAENR
ncbi:GGDEF domain-containing protein [Sutcliffiella cohnii]|uniref:GGDEF domain-containing protein n=1 Tax=Sutcliffiella cohnii TaxID=33932 RepID=UPI002E1BC124